MLVRRDLIVRFRQTYFGLAWLLFKPHDADGGHELRLRLSRRLRQEPCRSLSADHLLRRHSLVLLFQRGSRRHELPARPHCTSSRRPTFPAPSFPSPPSPSMPSSFLWPGCCSRLGCLWFGYLPGWQIVFFPLFCLQLLVLCTAIGLWLAVANVQFRDIGNLVPFLLMTGFFLTPAGYTSIPASPNNGSCFMPSIPSSASSKGLRWSLLRGMDGFPADAGDAVACRLRSAIGLVATTHFLAIEARLVDLV